MLLVNIKKDDQDYTVVADPTDTIVAIKHKVHEQGGPEVEKQTLIFAGKRLENHQALAELNLKEDTLEPHVIHMVVYKDAIGTITIQKEGEHLMDTQWDYSDDGYSVMHLKQEILKKLDLPHATLRKLQLFTHDGTKMNNIDTLRSHFQKRQSEHLVIELKY